MSYLHLHHPLVSMQTLCGLFGKSRQAWYDERKRNDKVDLQGAMLLSEVRRLWDNLPSVGAEILHHQLTDLRQRHDIKMGRDKLTNLLKDNSLLIRIKKRRA